MGGLMTDRNKLICIMSKIVPLPYAEIGKIAVRLIEKGLTWQRWIPVTERLPDVEGTYLVFTVSGCVTTARWYPERDVRNYRGDFLYHTEGKFHRNATHWMPLPEPPKED